MFSNHDSVVLDAHSPDVLQELSPSHVAGTNEGLPTMPHEALVAGWSIFFPPFVFRFSVFLDEFGEVFVSDNLDASSALVFLPYDWNGTQISIELEALAAAIAYFSLTPRRVFGRPNSAVRSVFSPQSIRDGGCGEIFSTINIGQGAGAELELIVCGNDVWPDKCGSADDHPDLSRICSSLSALLNSNDEALGVARLSIGDDGSCNFGGLYPLSSSQFLSHRETILRSIGRQVGR